MQSSLQPVIKYFEPIFYPQLMDPIFDPTRINELLKGETWALGGSGALWMHANMLGISFRVPNDYDLVVPDSDVPRIARMLSRMAGVKVVVGPNAKRVEIPPIKDFTGNKPIDILAGSVFAGDKTAPGIPLTTEMGTIRVVSLSHLKKLNSIIMEDFDILAPDVQLKVLSDGESLNRVIAATKPTRRPVRKPTRKPQGRSRRPSPFTMSKGDTVRKLF